MKQCIVHMSVSAASWVPQPVADRLTAPGGLQMGPPLMQALHAPSATQDLRSAAFWTAGTAAAWCRRAWFALELAGAVMSAMTWARAAAMHGVACNN